MSAVPEWTGTTEYLRRAVYYDETLVALLRNYYTVFEIIVQVIQPLPLCWNLLGLAWTLRHSWGLSTPPARG